MPQQHLKVKKGDLKKKGAAANKHGKGREVTKKGVSLLPPEPLQRRCFICFTAHCKLLEQ
jgi:hypothetical protein